MASTRKPATPAPTPTAPTTGPVTGAPAAAVHLRYSGLPVCDVDPDGAPSTRYLPAVTCGACKLTAFYRSACDPGTVHAAAAVFDGVPVCGAPAGGRVTPAGAPSSRVTCPACPDTAPAPGELAVWRAVTVPGHGARVPVPVDPPATPDRTRPHRAAGLDHSTPVGPTGPRPDPTRATPVTDTPHRHGPVPSRPSRRTTMAKTTPTTVTYPDVDDPYGKTRTTLHLVNREWAAVCERAAAQNRSAAEVTRLLHAAWLRGEIDV